MITGWHFYLARLFDAPGQMSRILDFSTFLLFQIYDLKKAVTNCELDSIHFGNGKKTFNTIWLLSAAAKFNKYKLIFRYCYLYLQRYRNIKSIKPRHKTHAFPENRTHNLFYRTRILTATRQFYEKYLSEDELEIEFF